MTRAMVCGLQGGPELSPRSVMVHTKHWPGDGAGEALASILFGDYKPTGKLPWQLPRSMDQLGGLTKETAREQWDFSKRHIYS